jgi:hypothetical protein
MAIKIDIPGFGEVSIEGAAQEDTMQAILAAVNKSDKSKAADEKKQKKATDDATKATENLTTGLDDATEAVAKSEREAALRNKKIADDTKKASKDAIAQIGNFGVALAATAASVATSMIKNIDANSENPIALGANLINTGIDVFSTGVKLAADATLGLAAAAFASVPILGGVLKGANDLTKAAVDAASVLAKTANEFMAAEFEKTVASTKAMTAAGASFANGLTGARQAANESGLGLTTFTNILVKSKGNFQAIGISATESTNLLSKGLSSLNLKIKGVGGELTTTRQQLQALGYGYEEQGEIMSLYMQQQAMAGKNLKNLAPEELAAGTKEYAKNLKLMADITGKDAKQMAAQAQAETMKAALMNKLDAKQRDAFVAAYGALELLGTEAATSQRLAMMQKLSGMGTSNVAEVVGDTNANNLNDALVESVRQGNATAESSKNIMVTSAKALDANSSKAESTGLAALAGASELARKFSIQTDSILSLKNADITNNKKLLDAQAATQDKATVDYGKAVDSVVSFQNQMEELASVHMADYAGLVVKSINLMKDTVEEGIKVGKDPIGYAKEKADTISSSVKGWFKENGTAIVAGLGVALGAGLIATGVGAPLGAAVVAGSLATGAAATYGINQNSKDMSGGTPSKSGGKPNTTSPGNYNTAADSTSSKSKKPAENSSNDANTAHLAEISRSLKGIAEETKNNNKLLTQGNSDRRQTI